METVLQQNPDLCGAVGVWDSADVGIGAAVQAAGKTGQVFVVTSGAGNKSACDNVEKGLLTMDISYNTPIQGEVAAQQIAELLQSKGKAGERKVFYYGPLTKITKGHHQPAQLLDDGRLEVDRVMRRRAPPRAAAIPVFGRARRRLDQSAHHGTTRTESPEPIGGTLSS